MPMALERCECLIRATELDEVVVTILLRYWNPGSDSGRESVCDGGRDWAVSLRETAGGGCVPVLERWNPHASEQEVP